MTNANNSECQSYDDLVMFGKRDFPTQNHHQISVDMPRTFPDEDDYKEVDEFDETNDQPIVLQAIERICTAYTIRN